MQQPAFNAMSFQPMVPSGVPQGTGFQGGVPQFQGGVPQGAGFQGGVPQFQAAPQGAGFQGVPQGHPQATPGMNLSMMPKPAAPTAPFQGGQMTVPTGVPTGALFPGGVSPGLGLGVAPAPTSTVEAEWAKTCASFFANVYAPTQASWLKTTFNLDVTPEKLMEGMKVPRMATANGSATIQSGNLGGALPESKAAPNRPKIPKPNLPLDTSKWCPYTPRGENKKPCGKPCAMGYNHCNDCLTKIGVRKLYEDAKIPLPGANLPAAGAGQLPAQPGFPAMGQFGLGQGPMVPAGGQFGQTFKPPAFSSFNPNNFNPTAKPAAPGPESAARAGGPSPAGPTPLGVGTNGVMTLESGIQLLQVPNSPNIWEEPQTKILVQIDPIKNERRVIGARGENNFVRDITPAERQMILTNMKGLSLPDAPQQAPAPAPQQAPTPQGPVVPSGAPQTQSLQATGFQPMTNGLAGAVNQAAQVQPAPQPQPQVQPAPQPQPQGPMVPGGVPEAPKPQGGFVSPQVQQVPAAKADEGERLDGPSVKQPDAEEHVGQDAQPQLEPHGVAVPNGATNVQPTATVNRPFVPPQGPMVPGGVPEAPKPQGGFVGPQGPMVPGGGPQAQQFQAVPQAPQFQVGSPQNTNGHAPVAAGTPQVLMEKMKALSMNKPQ